MTSRLPSFSATVDVADHREVSDSMFVLVVFALWMTLAIAGALVVSALGRAASSGDELSAISEPTPLAEVAPVAGHRSGEFARAADGLGPVTRPSRAIAGGRLR